MSETLQRSELLAIPSEELQEIVGQAPKGIVRWGMSVFIFVLLLIFCVSIFVKYADVLSGTFTLSASNGPKSVISKIDGKLQVLLSKEQDLVSQGQVLAYLESNGGHDEVIRLSGELAQIWTNIRNDRWEEILHHQPASYKKLGEMQSAYQTFIATYIHLNGYLKNGMYVQKKKLLQHELKNLSELKQNLQQQQEVHNQDYVLATQDFRIKQQLYEQKIIPLLEYKQEESKYLNKKLPLEAIALSIINNNNTIANKEQELIQLEQEFTNEKSNFLQALNTLISSTDEWKTKYLLMSPVAGKVAWPALLQEKQDVKAGQELFYIIPPAIGYYGEIVVPQERFGKLRLKQQVLISLSGFPYQEYGKLKGSISFISDIPDKDKQYHVGVKLENGLETDRQYTIRYSNGLIGTAEVITNKTRLINKFFYTIREILYKPKVKQSPARDSVTSK